jgi:feruloyl esterase
MALATASLAALALSMPASSGAQEAETSPQGSCEAMAMSIAMYGGLTHTSSQLIPAGPGQAAPGAEAPMLPEHCLVEGIINQREGFGGVAYGIRFELRLPTTWNGRFLLQGGGGLNGSVRPASGPVASGAAPALAHGFAVASHDSGHQGAGFDASFYADQRAALDFAESSVPVVTQTARMLTAMFYGIQPHHSYMTGCSTGGREGMLASQRYPELFDGIVIGAPAMRPGFSNLGIEWAQAMLNRTLPAGEAGPAVFSEAERGVIATEVLRQCDALDGVNDGMIANVEACRAFDPGAMQCAAGDDPATCLAPDRVEALRLAFRGPRDASGRAIYVPIPWDTGVTYTGPGLPGFLPMGQPGPFGPATTARDIDIDARVHDIRWDAVGRLTDTAYWTNLSTYLGRGSKLIYFHGVSDPWFSAFDTWDYFQRARAANGPEVWDQAARFYMVPGMMHCSGGNAFDQFDLLGPLVDWVERGEAPAAVRAEPTSGAPLSMPLCPHPAYPHFTGGEQMQFGSYECRTPEQ